MGILVNLKRREIITNSGNKAILKILDDIVLRHNPDSEGAAGEVAPEIKEERNPGPWNKICALVGPVVEVDTNAQYRLFCAVNNLKLDDPAFIFLEGYQELLTQKLLDVGKTSAELEKESCESRSVFVYHTLLRMSTLALSEDMINHRDGDVLIKEMDEFCDQLVTKDLLKNKLKDKLFSNNANLLPNFLSIGHKNLLNDMKVIVKMVKMIHAPHSAFSSAIGSFNELRMLIVRRICASLSNELREMDLGPLVLSTTFKKLEKKVFDNTLSLQLVGQAERTMMTQRCRAVENYVKKKNQAEYLKTLYKLLYETERLRSLVFKLDGLISVTSWSLLVSGAMNLNTLIEELDLHWKHCEKKLNLNDDHWLCKEHPKSWKELRRENSLGQLSSIEGAWCPGYKELGKLQDNNTLKLLERFVRGSFLQVMQLQKEFSEEGSDYSSLLNLDVLKTLGFNELVSNKLLLIGDKDMLAQSDRSVVQANVSEEGRATMDPVVYYKSKNYTAEQLKLKELKDPLQPDLLQELYTKLLDAQKKPSVENLSGFWKIVKKFLEPLWDFVSRSPCPLREDHRLELVWWLTVVTGEEITMLSHGELAHDRQSTGHPSIKHLFTRMNQMLSHVDYKDKSSGINKLVREYKRCDMLLDSDPLANNQVSKDQFQKTSDLKDKEIEQLRGQLKEQKAAFESQIHDIKQKLSSSEEKAKKQEEEIIQDRKQAELYQKQADENQKLLYSLQKAVKELQQSGKKENSEPGEMEAVHHRAPEHPSTTPLRTSRSASPIVPEEEGNVPQLRAGNVQSRGKRNAG